MHVFQSIYGISQLNESVTSISTNYSAITHEQDTIYPFILLHELGDVTVTHPLRYHREPFRFQIDTD